MGPAEHERISGLAERICRAMLESERTEGLPTRDILTALPLAIARYLAITMQGADRRHQLAAAEATLRHLGRSLLSTSYDRAAIGKMCGGSIAPENAPQARS